MATIRGTVHKYRDDVNTDEIIPARYLNTSDPAELAKHAMEDIDAEFPARVKPGDLVVAGKNFGCGSSREHAPIALKAAGVGCVVAATFARIFYRNAINIGLPIIESPAAAQALAAGEQAEVDLAKGTVKSLKTGQVYAGEPFPEFMQKLIAAGGLIPYTMANRK